MGQPRPLFNLFSVFFKQTSLQFLQQMYVKKCPSSIRCRDSNPQPLECESFPITTRPGLPPINVNLLLNAKHTMALFLIIWTNPGHFFYFRPFHITIGIQIEKASMSCLGFKPMAAGWQVQMDRSTYVWQPPI